MKKSAKKRIAIREAPVGREHPDYGDRRNQPRRFQTDRRQTIGDRRRSYPGSGKAERGKEEIPPPKRRGGDVF